MVGVVGRATWCSGRHKPGLANAQVLVAGAIGSKELAKMAQFFVVDVSAQVVCVGVLEGAVVGVVSENGK